MNSLGVDVNEIPKCGGYNHTHSDPSSCSEAFGLWDGAKDLQMHAFFYFRLFVPVARLVCAMAPPTNALAFPEPRSQLSQCAGLLVELAQVLTHNTNKGGKTGDAAWYGPSQFLIGVYLTTGPSLPRLLTHLPAAG